MGWLLIAIFQTLKRRPDALIQNSVVIGRLHCARAASLTAFAPTPGPPPQAAIPPSPEYLDRQTRRRELAKLIASERSPHGDSQKLTKDAPKRFWKQVSVQEKADGFQILLDGRPVRTASKRVLTVPLSKQSLAVAIALEWDSLHNAQQALKQHYIPLTSVTSRALDIELADSEKNSKIRDEITMNLLRYLDTDTLLCWVPEKDIHDAVNYTYKPISPDTLRNLQIRVAQPIIEYLSSAVWPGLELLTASTHDSILPTPQPERTRQAIRTWLQGLPPFELAGVEKAVLASKSLLVAARLLVEWSERFANLRHKYDQERRFGIEEATAACSLEVQWQTDRWGEVEDTHDVDKEDLRRQLGSAILLFSNGIRNPVS